MMRLVIPDKVTAITAAQAITAALLARALEHPEWLAKLDGEEVPCAPILPLSDVIRHPQVVANELLFETDHPVAGRIQQPRAAARFDQTPTTLDGLAPTLGQHTNEILQELGIERKEDA
jgi:crotonobetainyl-CoA:carnitine CoA-transferase CaiB-like acyl-CoA transferase